MTGQASMWARRSDTHGGDSTATYPIDGGATAIDPDGWLGGAYFGYNHHLPNGLVLGIDADIAHADISRGSHYIKVGVVRSGIDSLKLHWSGAIRGRAGYAVGRYLPYLAAGIAFSRLSTSTDDTNLNFVGSWDKIYYGYTVSAGVEHAVAIFSGLLHRRLNATHTETFENSHTVSVQIRRSPSLSRSRAAIGPIVSPTNVRRGYFDRRCGIFTSGTA